MDYTLVFDVTEKGLDYFFFMPLLFIFVGLGVSFFNIKFNLSTSPKKKFAIVFGFIFSGFALIMSLAIIPSELSTRAKTKKILENKEYKIVEGEIENFNPMPHSGHAMESFTVKDVYFEYSDYVIQYGFNQTASHGGPIQRNGQWVRLSYITAEGDNIILRIERKK